MGFLAGIIGLYWSLNNSFSLLKHKNAQDFFPAFQGLSAIFLASFPITVMTGGREAFLMCNYWTGRQSGDILFIWLLWSLGTCCIAMGGWWSGDGTSERQAAHVPLGFRRLVADQNQGDCWSKLQDGLVLIQVKQVTNFDHDLNQQAGNSFLK